MIYLEEAKKLKPETRKEFAKRQLQEDYRRSLGLFAKDLLGYKDLNTRTHGEVVRALESPTKRKLIVMPRSTFKSSLCSVAYPIWLLLNNPNLRIMLDSELFTNSKNFLREIRQHLESSRMIEIFGEFKSPNHVWAESEITIQQRHIIKKEASITASGIGAEKTGFHADFIIMDDMNSPNNSSTPEGCQKVVDHYRYAQAILDPGGTIVIVGTRYNAADLVAFVLENEIGNDNVGLI